MNTDELFAITIENGGATYDPAKDELLTDNRQGYIVGLVRSTYARVPVTDPRGFAAAFRHLRGKYPKALVGTWVSDGEIHIDPVIIFRDRGVAVGFALGTRQEAIFEVHTGKVIAIRRRE
jgi:hypothetical protein